jgi:hypothetical protein
MNLVWTAGTTTEEDDKLVPRHEAKKCVVYDRDEGWLVVERTYWPTLPEAEQYGRRRCLELST